MRIPRIYVETPLSGASTLKLEEPQSHYINKVLRMEPGRELILFCGDGAEYPGVITEIGKKFTEITINERRVENRESPLNTHLAIGISKGDRMEWVLQKATELGISEITPLFTERTEVRLKGERLEKKIQHWRQITISACEQCQRNTLPIFHDVQSIEDFTKEPRDGLKLVLHHRAAQPLKNFEKPLASTFLIGPEGGLSEQEIELALGEGFKALSLGPRVLRTETAPIAALSCMQLMWGDF